MPWTPSKIIVEEAVSDQQIARAAVSRFERASVEYVRRAKGAAVDGALVIARQRGAFIKKCPGTPVYQCCGYYVLNLGIGCFYNCTYCYLHHYMNSPFVIYANLDDLVSEVRAFARRRAGKIIRLGSGEFIDSAATDQLVDLNSFLIPKLSLIENVLFEVKTKSGNIDHLLGLKHNGRTVVSWSLNSIEMAETEEHRADPIIKRLEAAARCQRAGYKVGFHFDPLIYYPGWEAGYARIVDSIFESIRPENIAWISLGALRFNPSLKPIIKRKFAASRLLYGELVPGLDGKLRYFLPIRRRMFARLIGFIRAHAADVPIYLCMENKETANEVGAIGI